jgi:DNA-binding CsgD family transcriptional regulator
MRVALRGRNNLADGLFALGQLPDAVEEIERAIALCAEQDYDDSLGRLILSKLVYLLEMARFDEVIAACQVLVADPAHEWRGGPPGLLAVALTRTGRPGWEPHLRRELEIAVASPDLVLRVYSQLCDAEIKWLHDDPSWLPVLMGVYDALDVRFGWFRTMVAGWVRLLGGPELSIDPGPGPWELVVAGEWADAAALWRSRNQPYHEALTRLRLDDVQHVQEAHRLLVELDARPVAARAARRLRELNVEPRPGRGYARTTRANPAGLTAREVDVLRLVAEGLRNAEVADRLVLSPRTIDHHVSSVLRKLGVQSRSAAGRAAHALGLVDAVAS